MRDFHDAVLGVVELTWKSGDVALRLRTNEGSFRLTVRGAKELSLTRTFPWGPSEHVNIVSVAEMNPGVRVDVEMQSGDKITIVGVETSLQGE